MAYIPGYGFLSNPYIVFNDANGKPLSNGTVETYIAGTTTAYNTLKDWNGTYNGAIITLDIYGGCTIIAPETQGLKLIVKTSTGSLYKTFPNVFIGGSNQGYLPGTTVIRVDGTDGEIISVGTPNPDDPDKLIFTISLDPAITEAIATNASDISNIETSITNIENSLQTKESLQYTGFRIISGSGPYFVKIAEASFQSGYGSMDLTCGVGGSSTAYGEFSVKVIRAINGTSMYAQWNSLFNRASTFQLEEIRCFYVGPNDIQLWAKTASPFTQSSLSFEPLINVRYGSSGVATGRAFSFQKVGTTGSYPSTYVNYCLAKSVDCLSASDQRRTNVTSSDASVEVTKTETYDGKGYTNTFDVSVQSGQVDTYKSMCSTGDVPGYLQNKLVGSDWIDATEIQLSANEKNIMFALKNPDFFVKGTTNYGGKILPATTGDFNSPVHNGYFTCYYNTLNAPPVQPGNPSWFVHHMNSNAGVLYAVQIAYAYTTSIICYERTKINGVWQDWILRKDIIFDSIPQYGSTNPVTSNGIFNANSLIKANTDSKLNLRYATENGGYIYKIDASGVKTAITTTARDWRGICQGSDGYIYANVAGGYIYKIDATGTETAITSTARNWVGICQGSDGYIYANAFGGYIYKIDATGTETAITTTARDWRGICPGSDGYIYANVYDGYIYKIDATGTETAITTTARDWRGICQGSDGYIYANEYDGYIYKIDATGTETAITTSARIYRGICQGSDGYIYANEYGGYIYKIDATGTEYAIESTALGSWIGICQASSVLPQRNYGLTIVNNSTETAYTFTGRDENTCHIINTSTATTRTVPNYAKSPDFSVGSSIEIINIGSGVVTFAAEDGVTLLSSLTLVMHGQYSVCMLRKIAANTWILTGERTAV